MGETGGTDVDGDTDDDTETGGTDVDDSVHSTSPQPSLQFETYDDDDALEGGDGATGTAMIVVILLIALVLGFVYREEIRVYMSKSGGGGRFTRPQAQEYTRLPG